MIIAANNRLYTHENFKEWLESYGFDLNDVARIFQSPVYEEELLNSMEKHYEDWELIADGLYQNCLTAINEIEAIAQKLESGKGLTKAQAAHDLREVCDNYLAN